MYSKNEQLHKRKGRKISISTMHTRVWKVFAQYIRKRDTIAYDEVTHVTVGWCISCDRYLPYDQLEAGHFIARTNKFLIYHEDNVNAQCTRCNRFLHGNILDYCVNLEKKIGKKRVDYLIANKHTSKKWTVPELLELEEKYKTLLKEMQ